MLHSSDSISFVDYYQLIYFDNKNQGMAHKSYADIPGIEVGWNEEQWCKKIADAKANALNIPNISLAKLIPHEMTKDTVKQIESHSTKTQRFGHSQDLVGSLMMSCFHMQARHKKNSTQEIDKALWTLDCWRNEKYKQLMSKSKNGSKVAMPILSLPPQKAEKITKRNSYLFNKQNQYEGVIQQPGPQDFATQRNIMPTINSQPKNQSDDDAINIKYFLIDQIYHRLSQFATGQIKQGVLKDLVSLFRKYTDEDANFVVKVFEAYLQYSKNGDVYYRPVDDRSGMLLQFDDNEIVGIVGDWGTGQLDANNLLEQLVVNQKATIILHLGDVYYAGFPDEFKRISDKINLLQKKNPKLRYYAIAGNHDYYTFGGPYHEHLKKNHDNPEYIQQFGFFCLRNKSRTVQFIGLNTGKNQHGLTTAINFFYDGCHIEDQEVRWAIKRIQEFPGKSIVLTHHQLFSSFQGILGGGSKIGFKNPMVNSKLASQFFEVLPKVTCWLWGHEHRFCPYLQNSFGINRSIMLGNSSFQNDEENYYEIKYPCDGITTTKFQPTKGDQGYYHHTGMTMRDFVGDEIKAKYVYMTSSYDQPSIKVREEVDTIKGPVHVDIQYRKIYQLIEESTLSLSYSSNGIILGPQPANIQFINPNNPDNTGKVLPNTDLLIKIHNTTNYLYYSVWGYVAHGNYENQYKIEKHKYLWRIVNKTPQLQTGNIFNLYSLSRGQSMGMESNLGQMRLTSSETPSKFFLYIRQTTYLLNSEPDVCCNIM